MDSKKILAIRALQRGMTLVEIMVVVVIIGLIAGVASVQVFGQLEDANIKTTQTQLKSIENALDLYRLSNRGYPSTAEGLGVLAAPKSGAPVMSEIPKDPWGNDFIYLYPGTQNAGKFDLMSYGPDGVQGGGDDIGNWSTGDE